jgi:uncharacterized protein with ParB-like and HNH nuclease domain
MSIQEAYRLYSDKKLTVNRRYQRKLVWSEAEKKRLIDSIQKELPIPLFMFAAIEGEAEKLELIDGIQRLNAMFSFIEHCCVDELGRCFDLEQSSRAKLTRDAGVFNELPLEVPRLSAEEGTRFIEYQLAVTIDANAEEKRINEVFGGNGGAKVCHGSGVMVALRAA